MRKLTATIIGGVTALGFAAPAAAQSYGWQDHHRQEHRQLRAVHHEEHDQLGDEHAYAHETGLSRRGHRQLHRELRYEHRQAHHQLRHEHRDHDRDDNWNGDDGY